MSSYRTVDQDLPPYTQPSSGYQQQAGSQYRQVSVLQRNSRDNAPPRARDDEGNGDWDKVLGPGEFDVEALNVCKLYHFVCSVLIIRMPPPPPPLLSLPLAAEF